jgi:hypothetical protein
MELTPLRRGFFLLDSPEMMTITRVRAAAIHFGISAVIALTLLVLIWWIWYPPPLFDAVGGLPVLLTLLGVDVVLGPLLTLIVFNPAKKSLKIDLGIVACLQIFALVYGCITLWNGRPVYVAALGHRFDVVCASEIDDKELSVAMQSLPRWGVAWVGTKLATERKEKERILFSSLLGVGYGHYPQHHQPLENMRDEILKNAQPISDLKKENPGDEEAIDRWLEKRGVKADEVIYQGLKARAKDMAVIMDAKTAKVIGIAPFKPWP